MSRFSQRVCNFLRLSGLFLLAVFSVGTTSAQQPEELRLTFAVVDADEIVIDSILARNLVKAMSPALPATETVNPSGNSFVVVEFTGLDAAEKANLQSAISGLRTSSISTQGNVTTLTVERSLGDSDGAASLFPLLGNRALNFNLSRNLGGTWVQQTVPSDVSDLAVVQLAPTLRRAVVDAIQAKCAQASNGLGTVRSLEEEIQSGSSARVASGIAFDRACLGVIVPNAELQAVPAYVRDSGALRILGVLEYDDIAADGHTTPREFCSAFLVDSNTIVSARHCFYDVERPTALSARGHDLARNGIRFRRLLPPYEALLLDGKVPLTWLDKEGAESLPASAMRLAAGDDVIAFTLVAHVDSVPNVRFVNTASPQLAWVAGPTGVARDTPPVDASVPQSVRGVRWSRNATCAVIPRGSICDAHVCHLTSGASGAPFVSVQSGNQDVAVMGMHLGPYRALAGSCPVLPTAALQRGLNGAVRGSAFEKLVLAARSLDN